MAQSVMRNVRQRAQAKWREDLSDMALARRLKLAPNTLRYWDEGTAPRLDKLERVAKVLRCDVWELLHPDLPRLQAQMRAHRAMVEALRECVTRERDGGS